MTLAEIERAIKSKNRIIKIENQNRAMFDYTLSLLIGRNVARLFNSRNTIPTLEEAYPTLFDKSEEDNEKMQEQKNNLSVIRFKMFAQAHNRKYKGGETINE